MNTLMAAASRPHSEGGLAQTGRSPSRSRPCLLICGLAVLCISCGGGGGGGGGGENPPSSPLSVSISPSSQTNIDQGQTLKFGATVANDASGKGVTWSLSGAGVTGSACGTLTDTTTSAATYQSPSPVSANLSITVTATSVADSTKTASAVVVVSPPPSIATTTLTNATPNANYSASLQATGGVGSLTWSLAAGALPTGLAMSSSGAISGDPTVSGTFNFTVQATDSSTGGGGPASAQAHLSLTVVTVESIVTSALPDGSVGVTYLVQVGAIGGTPPYNWSVTAGALPAGLIMVPTSGVISGTPTSQGHATFAMTASDSSPTPQIQTQSLALTIGAPGPLAITTSALLNGTVNTPYNAVLGAIGGSPPYTWSLVSGALPQGVSLSTSSGALTGIPPETGTFYFTVRLTDASPAPLTQTQELSIAVNNPPEACSSAGNEAMLSGPYAFSLSGFNDAGFLAVVGSFTADGTGKITAGEADTNGVLGPQHGSIITTASSYSVGSDQRGCATLATPFGTLVTRFVLGSISSSLATAGRMIEWDSPSASAFIATGQLLRQTLSDFPAGLSGSYAYHNVGWDPSPQGGRLACAGVISANASTFSTMEQDCNNTWFLTNTAAPGAAGTYTPLDANGHGTGVLALGATNANLTFYAVSASQLLSVNADPGLAAGGEWRQQSLPPDGSGFTEGALAGNMVFYLSGLSLDGTATDVSMETGTADGSSSIALSFYEDRAGTMQASGTLTCTYAVEPTGRVTLSSSTQDCGGTPPVFYLSAPNTGFVVGAATGVDSGSFEPQSAGPYSNASLSGTYFGGMPEVLLQGAQSEVDPVTLNGSGSITGSMEMCSTSTQDTALSFLAATYTVNADGSFNLSTPDGAVSGIVISNAKFVVFSPSTAATSYPTLLIMQK